MLPYPKLFFSLCCLLISLLKAEATNVVFIVVDDLRPEINAFGASHMVTPAMDSLAGGGVFFSRAYCQTPQCGPSRASFMTGLRPRRDRFYSNNGQTVSSEIELGAANVTTLPELFKTNGYTTVSIGKVYHLPGEDIDSWSKAPFKIGAAGEWHRIPENFKEYVSSNYKTDAPPWEIGLNDEETDPYPDRQYANQATAEIDSLAAAGNPFFLAIGFTRPHLPFNAPQAYWDLYPTESIVLTDNATFPASAPVEADSDWGELRGYNGIPASGPLTEADAKQAVRGYYAAVSYVDSQIQRVLDALDDPNADGNTSDSVRANTLVVLIGDHGYNLLDHGHWAKHTAFETALRTPVIFNGPGVGNGGESTALMELIDVYPTLADLCGLPKPDHLEGTTLMPWLATPATSSRYAVFSKWQLGDSIKTDQFRYTEWSDTGGSFVSNMLYDHNADPDETVNISGDIGQAANVATLAGDVRDIFQLPVGKTTRWNDAGGGNFSDAANWTNGVPTIDDQAQFDTNLGGSIAVTVDVTTARAGRIQFYTASQPGSGAYTISGRPITVDGNGTNEDIVASFQLQSATQVIDSDLILAGTAGSTSEIDWRSNSTLELNGDIVNATGANHRIYLDYSTRSGTIVLGGDNSTGGWNLGFSVVNGAAVLRHPGALGDNFFNLGRDGLTSAPTTSSLRLDYDGTIGNPANRITLAIGDGDSNNETHALEFSSAYSADRTALAIAGITVRDSLVIDNQSDGHALLIDTAGATAINVGGGADATNLTLRNSGTTAGTIVFNGSLQHSGTTTLESGSLVLQGTAGISGTSSLSLPAFGALVCEGANTVSVSGALSLAGDAAIDLGTGGATCSFGGSSAAAWSGGLTISGNFTPTSIRFGTNANGLSADQLRTIRIGGDYAWLDANGYLQRLIATSEEVSGDNSGTDYRIVGGGQLSGTGTVGSINAAALAKVSPGTSGTPVATLAVAGNVDMELGTELLVDATRSGGLFSNDLIAAGGNVDFTGTIDLRLDGEPLQAGDEITVLTGTVPMPTYRTVPARVVVDPASPTPLPAGLELTVIYYSNKITIQARTAPAANILRNGGFEQGLFFWETSTSGGAASYAVESTVIDSTPTCLRIDIGSTGAAWADLQLFQHFRVQAGQAYTISFRYRVSGLNAGAGGNELAVSLSNSKLSRDFTNPAIGTFGPAGVNAPATGTWYTYTRNFTATATDAASLNILFGLSAAGTSIYIDDVRVTTTGNYPPEPDGFKVVGYIPAYRFGASDLITTNPEFFENIDTLIYGFIMTDASGGVLEYYQQAGGGTQWNYTQAIEDALQSVKTTYGLELLVALGGGGVDETIFFNDVLSDSGKRATLIANLITFCNTNGFDGVDMDYEYAATATNQQENYELFVEEALAAFTGAKTGGGDLVLTAAVDTFARAYYPPDAYTAHSSNHLMGYALDFDEHVKDIFELFKAGAPMASIHPGIIWSGDTGSASATYKTIVDLYAPARHENQADGYAFNGIDAVRQKIQLARALGCGGVMIWELGHDTGDAAQSLIRNALEDADDDALLDAWEQTHSGGINLRTNGDDDHDGLWNLWENLTGTDPLDASSRSAPEVVVQNLSGSDYMAISFPYVNPLRFDLIVSGSDDLTLWTDLDTGPGGNVVVEENAGTLTVRQTNPIPSAISFPFMRAETRQTP